MFINTNQMVTITEVNQNFSQVARKVEEEGSVVIFKNNKPRFILIPFREDLTLTAKDQDVDAIAAELMGTYQKTFEALAK